MKIGEFEFEEGDRIRIGAYTFEIRHGEVMLQKFTVFGGLAWVGFECGVFLLLLQNVPSWSIMHKPYYKYEY